MNPLQEALQGHPTLQDLGLRVSTGWGDAPWRVAGLLAQLPALQRLRRQAETFMCAELLDDVAQCGRL